MSNSRILLPTKLTAELTLPIRPGKMGPPWMPAASETLPWNLHALIRGISAQRLCGCAQLAADDRTVAPQVRSIPAIPS